MRDFECFRYVSEPQPAPRLWTLLLPLLVVLNAVALGFQLHRLAQLKADTDAAKILQVASKANLERSAQLLNDTEACVASARPPIHGQSSEGYAGKVSSL